MNATTGVRLVGAGVFAVGIATTLPLPLYGAYAARGGHGAGGLSIAFACYALTLIVTAPLLGPLPDKIGRKPCVLAGLLLAGVSTLVLYLVPDIPALAAARVAQGLAMGCVTGAGVAWAAELAGGDAAGARRAASVVAAATIGSFALGAIGTLLCVWIAPADLRPPTFPAHLLFILALLPLLARLRETLGVPAAGGWLRRPAFPRGTLATTCAILPGWGTTATVLTSGQALVAAQQALGGVAPRPSVRIGLALLVVAAGLAFLGAILASLPLFVAGASGVGIGVYAFIYRGGLGAVSEAATGEERARAVAGYFLVAHVGFSIVPMLAGLAVDAFGGAAALGGLWALILVTAIVLGVAIRRAPLIR